MDGPSVQWRDTMRPVRIYMFDARLLALATVWIFLPSWWTTAVLLAAAIGLRIAEARGYGLPAALRALRARSAGRRRALEGWRTRRFVDFG